MSYNFEGLYFEIFWQVKFFLATKITSLIYTQDTVLLYPNNKSLHKTNNNPYTTTKNKISTTKYKIYNFIFLNLYEQLTTRWANLYFLFIAVINYLPWSQVVAPEMLTFAVSFIIGATMLKDAYEDYRRHQTDKLINQVKTLKYNFHTQKYDAIFWEDVLPGDILRINCSEFIPADCLILNSREEGNIAYLQTSNLDGESNLKQFQAVQKGKMGTVSSFLTHISNSQEHVISCEEYHNINFLDVNIPTPELYNIIGKINITNYRNFSEDLNFNSSNILLRGCILRNTDYVDALVLFTGEYTKTRLNSKQNRRKTSNLEILINKLLPINFITILVLDLGICIGCYFTHTKFEKIHETTLFYNRQDPETTPFNLSWQNFISFLISVQTIVPIAIYVSWEVVKFVQIYFIHQDLKLYDKQKDQTARCNAYNINEDLGQIEYIFSDKTGTLTENVMLFRSCSIAGVNYHVNFAQNSHKYQGSDMPRYRQNMSKTSLTMTLKSQGEINPALDHFQEPESSRPSLVRRARSKNSSGWQNSAKATDPKLVQNFKNPENLLFFICLATCHSALVAKDLEDDEEIRYESESADELALLDFCQLYGVIMSYRSKTEIRVEFRPQSEKETLLVKNFKILHFRKFDPKYKRMGIMVQDISDNQIYFFVKGADEVILEMIDSADPIKSSTIQQIDHFAEQGLRTLCMAYKNLEAKTYHNWLNRHFQPAIDTFNEDKINQSFEILERDHMSLLGGTGIEDKLQPKVPHTIDFIRSAGIKLWVITGDKLETAINIGKSTKLLKSNEFTLVISKISNAEQFIQRVDQFLDPDNVFAAAEPEEKSSLPRLNSVAASPASKHASKSSFSLAIDGQSLDKVLASQLAIAKFLQLISQAWQVVTFGNKITHFTFFGHFAK